MESFDGNALNFHYLMILFKEVVESKVDDPRGRLTSILSDLSTIRQVMQRSSSNIVYSCRPVRDLRMPNTFWKRFMRIHIKFLFHIEGKSSSGHKLSLEMQRASENSIISCSSVEVYQQVRDGMH